jgi:dienelactone hydrolase
MAGASVTDGDPVPEGDNPLGLDCLHPSTTSVTYCSMERYVDRTYQPQGNTAPTYGVDPYRTPSRAGNAGSRFRYQTITGLSGIGTADLFMPCPLTGPDQCTNTPPGVVKADPPYPVAIVVHGAIASKELHRCTTEMLAEEGYIAIAPSEEGSTVPLNISYPNFSNSGEVSTLMDWIDSTGVGLGADTSRIGLAGHSQGGASILGVQNDPRVSALVVYDGGTTANATTTAPILYMGEDGAFTFAPPRTEAGVPGSAPDAASGYTTLRGNQVDSMAIQPRAFAHTDYNCNGGPGGERWSELIQNYYTLAWMDRYVKGRLVVSDGAAVTTPGVTTTEAEERAYRQSIAQGAFGRLTATTYDGSSDIHDISMGFWDPAKAIAYGDPLFGGNVPYGSSIYHLAGQPVAWRLSEQRSVCYTSVPDYVNGNDTYNGGPDSVLQERADSTLDGDIRTGGCPTTFVKPPDPA